MTALASMTSPEVDGFDGGGADGRGVELLLVPLGSCEQHGPHLPLDTDTRVAWAVAERAAAVLVRRGIGAVVAPSVAVTASGEHAGFAGTLSIGTEALGLVIVELARSATWARRLVFVNGHGGNHEAVTAAVAQLRDEGHAASAWAPRLPGADAHAGRTETSLMLAIAPDAVRLDRIEAGATAPLDALLPRLRAEGVAAVSPNGVLGDPTGATPAEGAEWLDRLVADLVAHCTRPPVRP